MGPGVPDRETPWQRRADGPEKNDQKLPNVSSETALNKATPEPPAAAAAAACSKEPPENAAAAAAGGSCLLAADYWPPAACLLAAWRLLPTGC